MCCIIYDDDDDYVYGKTFCVVATIVSGSWGKSVGSDHIWAIFINELFQLL